MIRHRRPLGYLQSVTDAAALATGTYLLLLNNDLVLHRHCVANLLATFATHPAVGLVAPRFVDQVSQLKRFTDEVALFFYFLLMKFYV